MLGDLSASLKKRVIRGALKQAIQVVDDEIRPNTPVHLGILKESAETKVSVSSDGTRGKATFGYGLQNRQALLVEYGHAMVTHDGKEVGNVPPHPWILPGLDRALPTVEAVFDAAVEEAVINYER